MGLKMALRHYHENLVESIRDEIEPTAVSNNADQFYEKELFRKMRSKLKRRGGAARKLRSSSSNYLDKH